MNSKTIRLNKFRTLGSLKEMILKKCNLYGNRKNTLNDFDSAIKGYRDRIGEKLVIVIDWGKVNKDLSFQVSMENRPALKMPDNYDTGNPLNRWLHSDSITMTAEEIKERDLAFDRKFNERLAVLNDFLAHVEKLGAGRIVAVEADKI